MSKIEQFADDVPNIIRNLEDEFGDLGERARALKERGRDVADAWHAHFDAKDSELKRAEEAIKRVSNIPLPAGQHPPKSNGSDKEILMRAGYAQGGVDAKPAETAQLPEAKAV